MNRFSAFREVRPADWAFWICISGVWLWSRAYKGLQHDAMYYVAQASSVAANSPLRLDVFFSLGGQQQLSASPFLLAWLIKLPNPDLMVMLVTLGLLSCWVWLLCGLALRLARTLPLEEPSSSLVFGSVLLTSLGCLAAPTYGWSGMFTLGEPFLSARLPAEVLVMAGLLLSLGHKPIWAILAVIGAVAVHPLTGAAGLGMLLLMWASRWRPSVVAALAVAVGVSVTAVLFVAQPTVLVQSLSADTVLLLQGTNPLVWLFAWGWREWAQCALVCCGLWLCGAWSERGGVLRRLAWSALALQLLGLGLALLGGDVLSNALVVAAQPWRVMWVGLVVFWLLLPLVAVQAWQKGRRVDGAVLAAMMIGSVLVQWSPYSFGYRFSGAHGWVYQLCGLAVAAFLLMACMSRLIATPVRTGLAVACFAVALLSWDQRSDWARVVDAKATTHRELEGLDLDTKELGFSTESVEFVWFFLKRASYYSAEQWAAAPFSESLARTLQARRAQLDPVSAALKSCRDKQPACVYRMADLANICRAAPAIGWIAVNGQGDTSAFRTVVQPFGRNEKAVFSVYRCRDLTTSQTMEPRS